MRTRSRRAVPSNWRRGFDWDSVTYGVSLPPFATVMDWARVPSDTTDPISGTYILPKTLVKTLLTFDAATETVGANYFGRFILGMIAWDSSNGNPPTSLVDFPDPTNGSAEWVFWLPQNLTAINAGLSFQLGGNGAGPSDGGVIEISAQRKLPPGTGLLWVAYYESNQPGVDLAFQFTMRLGLKGDVTAVGLGGG